jgi:phosphoglycerate dehydrogenase-like enzyme
MRTFRVAFTGDYLDAAGKVAYGDIGLGLLGAVGYIEHSFLLDQKPAPQEVNYWDRLYSMEVQPEHIAGVNALVIFRPGVKGGAFAAGARDLVVIGRAGTGYDKIDVEACTANDVALFITPDTLTHSTASAALVFILALAKRLPEQERLARTGRWDRQSELLGDDLPGLTLGIVGLGRSGRELARLVAPFQMRVIAFSPRADPSAAKALRVTLVPTLAELLREAEFVSLHCRLDERTRGMIGEKELRLMKPTAYFINVARGELVDQAALVRCLRERRIAGAGLDVFEEEPLPAGDPLMSLDNVILTPHWLPSTRQAARATMNAVVRGILRAARGEVPENVVNCAVLERPGFRTKLAGFATNARESGQ